MSDQPVPPYKFDRARWSRNDQITGVATVVLFIALFLPWFGVRVGARGYSVDVNAVLVEVDPGNGKASSIQRLDYYVE